MEVAQKQDFIRYFDSSKFNEEIEKKRLLLSLKTSENRNKKILNINSTYKTIIDIILKVVFVEVLSFCLKQLVSGLSIL